MNKPNRNENAKYKTVDQIMAETNLCRGNVMKIADEAGCIVRYGRAVRIIENRFYEYLEREYKI